MCFYYMLEYQGIEYPYIFDLMAILFGKRNDCMFLFLFLCNSQQKKAYNFNIKNRKST